MQQNNKELQTLESKTFNTKESKTQESDKQESDKQESKTQESDKQESNTSKTQDSVKKESKFNRRRVSNTKERGEIYNIANILDKAKEAMQNDISDLSDKKSAKADCLLPDPTDVATMMKRIYQTEFPHVDVNTVFVSG